MQSPFANLINQPLAQMRYSVENMKMNTKVYLHRSASFSGTELNELGVAVFLPQTNKYIILENEILRSFPCSLLLPRHVLVFSERTHCVWITYKTIRRL